MYVLSVRGKGLSTIFIFLGPCLHRINFLGCLYVKHHTFDHSETSPSSPVPPCPQTRQLQPWLSQQRPSVPTVQTTRHEHGLGRQETLEARCHLPHKTFPLTIRLPFLTDTSTSQPSIKPYPPPQPKEAWTSLWREQSHKVQFPSKALTPTTGEQSLNVMTILVMLQIYSKNPRSFCPVSCPILIKTYFINIFQSWQSCGLQKHIMWPHLCHQCAFIHTLMKELMNEELKW